MNVGRYLRCEDSHTGTARTTKAKKENSPMDTPLPCDVKVGHVTIRKGVALSVLVARMQVLYDMAQSAMAQPEQEPVVVARVDDLERGGRVRALAMGLGLDKPLYTTPPQRELTDEQKDAARWRWLSWHIKVAWDEGKFTSLVRIVSDKDRESLNASIDRMMAGDWSDADAVGGIRPSDFKE